MDVENSDSLAPLLAYHGFTVPAASASASSTTSSSSSGSTTMITTRVSSTGEVKQSTTTTNMGLGGIHAASVTPSMMGESLLGASTLSSSNGMGGSSLANGTSTSSLPAVQEGDGGSQETSRRGSVHDTEDRDEAASAAASTASSSGSTNGGANATSAVPVESVPALIIQHSTRRLTTYLHALIPRYNDEGKLVRYDPVHSHSKLNIHEEYRLDSNYHTINTARGRVAARAYFAPHGQSLVVDTRCASKYDLERTERFLEDDGKRLVIETRILSCAPEVQNSDQARITTGVSSKFDDGSNTPVHTVPSQPQQQSMVVKELLFLRRVFKRIVDANPDGPKSNQGTPSAAAAASSSSSGSSGVPLPAFGSAASAPPTPMKVETTLDFDEAATTGSTTARTRTRAETGAGAIAAENAAASKASLLRMQLSPAALAILPEQLTRATKSGGASSGAGATASGSSGGGVSAWSQLTDLLYPRHFLLKRYQLTDLLFEGPPGSTSAAASAAQMPSTLSAAIAAEHSAHSSARRWMRLVDLVLLCLLIIYILLQLGVFSREDLAHELSVIGHAVEDGVMAGAQLVEGQVKEHMPGLHAAATDAVHSVESIAMEISQVANTIKHAPGAAASSVAAAVSSEPLHSEL